MTDRKPARLFQITVRSTGRGPAPTIIALRLLLKRLLRSGGLVCVDARELPADALLLGGESPDQGGRNAPGDE